jgi:hypothetical protein
VRSGREEDQTVDAAGVEHLRRGVEPGLRSDPIPIADRVPQRGREVGDGSDLESLREAGEEGKMDRLRDRAETGDADAERMVG